MMLALVLLGCAAAASSPADQSRANKEKVNSDSLVTRRISAFRADLHELRQRLGIPGLSVAVARNGSLIWSEGFGFADAETETPATPDTPYRVASITKTMTAVVVLRLAEEGLLDLDDPVARHISWQGPDTSITVRQVLTHTSEGVQPGLKFVYSGRYDLLADIAASAAGRPFAVLLEEMVIEPARMTRTIPVSHLRRPAARPLREHLATPHFASGARADADALLPDRTFGGNGVVSTVRDLVNFVGALTDGTLLPATQRQAMWTAMRTPAGERLPYGLGWFVESTPVLELRWHGGQWPVYSGLLLHVPEPGLTLAILANSPSVSLAFYDIGTGTALFNAFAASFLRHFALDEVYGSEAPALAWEAQPQQLAEIGEALADRKARHYYGAELIGRGLVARAAGEQARSDGLLAAALECCPGALQASADLGLLFHLGRSGDPAVRRLGQAAGRRRLARFADDALTRFHLAISYAQAGDSDRARPLLESLLEERDRIPGFMWGWSAYVMAESIASDDPDRARALLRQVLERGVDESGLLDQARQLLDALERDP